jgi:uncharacterized protein with PIN domain
MRWAQLLKRVFDIDIERCPHCGGPLKLIAAIEDAAAITRLLTHLHTAMGSGLSLSYFSKIITKK